MTILKYKAGDEFFVKMKVTDTDPSDSEDTYLLEGPDGKFEQWVSEEFLDSTNEGEEAIGPGCWVRPRSGSGVGKVIAIRKGMAWVDWNPNADDDTAVTSRPIGLLIRLTAEELEEMGLVTA
jgi:hypothetical protein